MTQFSNFTSNHETNNEEMLFFWPKLVIIRIRNPDKTTIKLVFF